MKSVMRNWYFEASSSSDEEDTNLQIQSCSNLVPCKNGRCDQELLCVNNMDYYCSRDCYWDKLERDKIGDTGILLKRVTIKGRGGTGLLRDRRQLDHLMIEVDDVRGRVVTVNNSGISGQRWKRHSGKKVSTTERMALNEAGRKEKEEQNQRLKQLLNPNMCASSSSEESTSDDDNNQGGEDLIVQETAREEIRSMLSSGVNSNICRLHPAAGAKGTTLKGYIINVVSPWELYIQTEQMVLKTLEIDAICNRPEGIDPRLILPHWQPEIEGFCVAKYDDVLHRAKILEKVGSSFRVKYMDYGNISLVSDSQVFQLNPEVTLIPRQYLFVKMSNVKPLNREVKWSELVCEFLMEHLDGGIVELHVEAVDRRVIHWGTIKVISSLSEQVKGDIGNILVKKKMAEKDSYYILKHCSINSKGE